MSAQHEVRAHRRSALSAVGTACCEQLVSIPHLGILRMLNLRPAGGPAVGAVRPVRPLRDDAFKVTFTCHAKQIATATLTVIEGTANASRWSA
jgi:hypothetical protein